MDYKQKGVTAVEKFRKDLDRADRQACFRLGQLDMRESAVAMLRQAADQLEGLSRAMLIAAADMVEKMQVME